MVLNAALPVLYQATLGWVPNVNAITKFGRNPDVDASGGGPEDVWEGGGLYTGFPAGVVNTVAETCTVVSSSANDAAAGTGMRTCRLSGLGATGAEQLEDVTLNGTNAVTTTNRWYRVNRVVGLTGGSGMTNAGAITVRHSSTTANIFAVVPAGFGQSQIACYTVPANEQGMGDGSVGVGVEQPGLRPRSAHRCGGEVVRLVDLVASATDVSVDDDGRGGHVDRLVGGRPGVDGHRCASAVGDRRQPVGDRALRPGAPEVMSAPAARGKGRTPTVLP